MSNKISVITVCFNPGPVLKKTIDSVISNMCDNVEYIIMDGKSTDGTVAYLHELVRNNNKIKFISEADDGIYDAMNKGISSATGDWLIFMNAGDEFFTSDTLKKSYPYLDDDYSIVYGDMYCKGKIIHARKIKSLSSGIIMACHQSMFFNKRKLSQNLKYDLSYPIYGDYELVVRIINKFRNSTKHVNIVISKYEGGGISDKISKQKRVDKYNILYKYYGATGVCKGLLYWFFNKMNKFFCRKVL